MKRLTWLFLSIVVVVAIGGAVLTWGPDFGPGGGGDKLIGSTSLTDPDTADRVTPESQSTADNWEKTTAFEFRRFEVDASQDDPEACLIFTREIEDNADIRLADYLRFEPQVKVSLRISGKRLCIGGLAFNKRYTVEIREGLPSKSGEKLALSESIPLELRNREPTVGFEGGILLPREGADGLPIQTVNVETLDIKVIRVNDRLLARLRQGLLDEQTIYGYDEEQFENDEGEVVWTGQMPVASELNEDTTTLFPIRRAIPEPDPGVYLVIARDAADAEKAGDPWDLRWAGAAAQWVIDTDIGLTTFSGQGGFHVFARSLATAEPISGLKIALVARNNDELGRLETGVNGQVSFPAGLTRGAGGAEPVAVMAYGDDSDFTFLDLRRPSFDLTDRGVAGREAAGPVDAYLYTERGIYRPGHAVHLVTMLRDQTATAIKDGPVTIKVTRPDGAEFRSYVEKELTAGTIHTEILLTESAARGTWQASAYLDPKGEPLGRVRFEVQDFVPQKLALELAARSQSLKPGDDVAIDVTGRFLYGAPADALEGEGELRLIPDPAPFEDYKHYSFGLTDEIFEPTVQSMSVSRTDTDGKTLATGFVENVEDITRPLKADITVSLFEPGGRATSDTLQIPVRTSDTLIGIRQGFRFGYVREDSQADFDIVALDAKGEPITLNGLDYELVREDVDYHWYQVDEEWRYERIVRDRIVSSGKLDISADKPVRVSHLVKWGGHRLVIKDPNSSAASSSRFYAGWGGDQSVDRPDRIAVTTDEPAYKVGDTATVSIRPPSAGKALVMVANHEIIKTEMIDVTEDGATVELPVSKQWGSGAYVLVSSYRPLTRSEERAPVRAIGLTWVAIDQTERTLALSMDVPDVVAPREKLTVPVSVSSTAPGGKTHVTLAAVDEGILQLTRFKSPSATDHFFGKRRLGFDVRDDYGRLIHAQDAQVGEIRVGGDTLGGRGLSAVPARIVALFSGTVPVDADGVANVELDVPDFNGELRLMAVAFNGIQLGNMERSVTVRDPVVGEVALPRFLAPGDQGQATLVVHNVEGIAGDYRARVRASGSVALAGEGTHTISLVEGQRVSIPITLNGDSVGIGTVNLGIDGPGGFSVQRAWPIEVRPPVLPQFREDIALIEPGTEYAPGASLVANMLPGTESVSIKVSANRDYDVASLLRWMDRYPYGCLEQTTSRAMPLLVFNDVAVSSGLDTDERVRARVQNAVERIVDMQSATGSFGMWSAYGSDAASWIGIFAMDFLLQAQQKDYVVPQAAIERGLTWLRTVAGQHWQSVPARSYAFYVLAREGRVNPGDLRYFADEELGEVKDVIASGMTAAALAQIGDRSRAKLGFDTAATLARAALPATYRAEDYGSLLRDVSGLIAVAAEADQTRALPALVERSTDLRPPIQFTTTQEKAWMLRAAHALQSQASTIDVDVQGARVIEEGKSIALMPSNEELNGAITIRNNGEKPIWRTVTVEGIPTQPLPPHQSVVNVKKTYWTLDGQAANLATVKQNDRFIVSITGGVENHLRRDLAVLDLLPAGFEIESVLGKSGNRVKRDWLPKLSGASVTEARDDRFVAALTVGSNYRRPRPNQQSRPTPTFHVAYIVRAVTPGSFVVPAAHVEDMYRPDATARTAPSQLQIAAP